MENQEGTQTTNAVASYVLRRGEITFDLDKESFV